MRRFLLLAALLVGASVFAAGLFELRRTSPLARAFASCPRWVEQTSYAPTAADLALPVVARLEDTGLISQSGRGCSEYSDDVRSGNLGPLAVEYSVWNYKGQLLSDGFGASVFDPACPSRPVPITMHEGRGSVMLRSDPGRGLYFVSTGHDPAQTVTLRTVTAK
jgi:hypothetical protein